MPADIKTHRRACPLCEAICGLVIETQLGEVISIRGDKEDPFSRGHICPKAVALKDIQEDPDRLTQPMKREGRSWVPISWDEALEYAVEGLAQVREKHGANAVGVYQGNPNVHNWGMMTHASQFLGLLKTRNRFSATSVDQLPHQLMVYWMYGHQLLIPIPDIDHTDYMLVLGANPMASNGSLMTVPDVSRRIKALQARGGEMVVIDPRRTETAKVANAHHFIKPGTDAVFLMAVINTIVSLGLSKLGRLAEMTDGLDDALASISGVDVHMAEKLCGIAAADIEHIAKSFALASRAVCYGRMGISTQIHGTLCQWLVQLLNLITGNLDRVGGSLVTKPALDLLTAPGSKKGSYGRWYSRVSQRPEVLGEFPSSVMAEEMLNEGEGQIKAMVTVAGNPVLSTPNGRQLDKAFESLDFMVSVDMYLNETTRHANVILPTSAPLEHDHYDLIFNIFGVRNQAKYSEATLPRPKDVKHDWELMGDLANLYAKRTGQAVKPTPPPQILLDFGLQMGPYGATSDHRLSLEKLKMYPEGVDLGALSPSFPERLMTDNKRIQACPAEVRMAALHYCASLMGQLAHINEESGYLLFGRRQVRSNNSWMHNYERLVKGQERCTLLIHPEDAKREALVDGQRTTLKGRVGEIQVDIEVSNEVMQGTLSLPHGWGHNRAGIRQRVAEAHAGVSANDLTDEQLLDAVSGNAAINGVRVHF